MDCWNAAHSTACSMCSSLVPLYTFGVRGKVPSPGLRRFARGYLFVDRAVQLPVRRCTASASRARPPTPPAPVGRQFCGLWARFRQLPFLVARVACSLLSRKCHAWHCAAWEALACWLMLHVHARLLGDESLIPLLIHVIDQSLYSYPDSSRTLHHVTLHPGPLFHLLPSLIRNLAQGMHPPELKTVASSPPVSPSRHRARRDCQGHHPHGRLPALRRGQGEELHCTAWCSLVP
jgi:hypothetical protein